MSKGQLPTTPYELKMNFKKCPVCKSKNIHPEDDSLVLICEDCGSKFFRRVSTDNPKDSEILLYFSKATHPFVSLSSKEVVTFT